MPQAEPTVKSLDHLVLTVADIAQNTRFYATAMGMTLHQFTTPDGEIRQALRFGNTKINLHRQGAEFEPKAARPTPGSADLCFLTDLPLADWMTHLDRCSVPIEQGPVARTGTMSPLTSIYIRDPDRNLVEIAVEH
ncbi:VOC family protein [Sulfitobacter sp. F26204]|uniref:VOC family protein n=1 Tax=Sulfitobacter sp. F26204 TaxID=2996014 RepID=UPI00225E04AF|nr:VOC family protein [Sulfitobacter sp. F26204]MCX7558491.1 VOC family protein [Sulfitobacter sp. F26204]